MGKEAGELGESVWPEHIVVVEQDDEIAPSGGERVVGGTSYATIDCAV